MDQLEMDKARLAILIEKKKREDDCAKEMMDLLKRNNCTLDVAMVIKPNKHPEVITAITAL